MDKDLDILAQKFLANDLSKEEMDFVASVNNTDAWKTAVETHESLAKSLKKKAFLEQQAARVSKINLEKSGVRFNRGMMMLVGVAAAIVFLIILLPNWTETGDTEIAQTEDVRQKSATETKDNFIEEKSAAEDIEDGSSAPIEQFAKDTAVSFHFEREEALYNVQGNEIDKDNEFQDQDITNNASMYRMQLINAAAKGLEKFQKNPQTGIISMILDHGSVDSVYVFAKSLNDDDYEKHLRYVGETSNFEVFVLISFNNTQKELRRSILIYDKNENYKGRYVVSSVDDLPDATSGDDLVFVGYNGYDYNERYLSEITEKLDCIDLPKKGTSCLAKF